MHDKMKKILSKKRDLHPIEKEAKMDVIKHLRDMASHEMGGKLDGLKKVSVMSDSEKGLEHGLDKAKDILTGSEFDSMKNHAENPYGDYKSAMEEHADDEDNEEKGKVAGYNEGGEVEDDDSDKDESEEESESPDEDMSEEEIDTKLAELMALKKKKEEAKKV